MILHTVNSSPFQSFALNSCLKLLDSADSLLLIEDAVVASHAQHQDWNQLLKLSEQGRLYVLTADLKARAIENKIGQACDYNEFVNLVLQHKSQLAW